MTSAPRALALARMAEAGLTPPRTFIAGEDIAVGKPAPDCFLLGAERLGVPASQCVVFEDAPVGFMAAEAAGAGLVAVSAVHQHPAPHALFAIDSYDELEVAVEADGLVLRKKNG